MLDYYNIKEIIPILSVTVLKQAFQETERYVGIFCTLYGIFYVSSGYLAEIDRE